MQKRNQIVNVFLLIIYISLFPLIFSHITQLNSTELQIFYQFINKSEELNLKVKRYGKKMRNIKYNLKLKGKFRTIKKLNDDYYKNVIKIKKKLTEVEIDKNKLMDEMVLLTNNYNILMNKFVKFDSRYKNYENFKSKIYEYIKIFFICFFSVVIILLIILAYVGIYMYKKKRKYFTLHEEVSFKHENKMAAKNEMSGVDKDARSEERNIKEENLHNIPDFHIKS